ncbi:GNAT family N-acetyltransferase [Candidatus Cyanaurora vandensis]|uniref:GNAT family N-acetyltransferase n=1 Tax=Candidatus Cyanaurora vandensis TaxID=2714958 RepID=UPI00258014DE|nr:GNAT family N-acetyltransferase [Candidatus Cyanaurora vandensis]
MSFWKRLFPGTEATEDSPRDTDRITFSTDRAIDIYELEELCDAVGWSRRPLRKVKKAIECSFCVIAMYEEYQDRRRLIGFARATSDHAFNATIWDVVVHPDCQGRGMGKSLMDRIIAELRSADISNITLFADPHVVDFYRRLGFMSDPEGIKGMFWYPD